MLLRIVKLLTNLSLASFLWDIGKQNSPKCDTAKCGVPSGAILFEYMNVIEKIGVSEIIPLMPLKRKWTNPFDKDGKIHLAYFC